MLGFIKTQMGPRHKARAVPRNERGGFGRVALTIRRGFWARLLIGCVSVISYWRSLRLCDTAFLCTAIKIPMAEGHLVTPPTPAVPVVRLEFCGL